MTEREGFSKLEPVQQLEYRNLFSNVVANIEDITAGIIPDEYGHKQLSVKIDYTYPYIYYFDHTRQNEVGIYFSREHGRDQGQTYYMFHKNESPSADIQGYYGVDVNGYPDLWISPASSAAPKAQDAIEMEKVRKEPVEIDLTILRDLNAFIENPIKNRHLIEKLQKFPGEDEYKEWAKSLRKSR